MSNQLQADYYFLFLKKNHKNFNSKLINNFIKDKIFCFLDEYQLKLICCPDAPVFISQPHFYNADSRLLDAVEGLKPDEEKHKTYFKINPVRYSF